MLLEPTRIPLSDCPTAGRGKTKTRRKMERLKSAPIKKPLSFKVGRHYIVSRQSRIVQQQGTPRSIPSNKPRPRGFDDRVDLSSACVVLGYSDPVGWGDDRRGGCSGRKKISDLRSVLFIPLSRGKFFVRARNHGSSRAFLQR